MTHAIPNCPATWSRSRIHTTRLGSRGVDGRWSHTYEPAAD